MSVRLPFTFKNASAFLLRDARHAKHDILLLRILSNPAGGYIDGDWLPPLILICFSPPEEVGSHLTSDITITTLVKLFILSIF